jgi:hypothetical protein
MATETADRNFIVQQGIEAPPQSCARLSAALLFQPRVVAPLAVIGVITQSAGLFGALAVVLWWSALVPSLNPFDQLWNGTFGRRPGASRISPAPGPRRFSQGMAASFMTAIALSLAAGQPVAAWVLQGFLLVAVAAISLGKFCLGSFVFHLLRGRVDFAIATLPWGRGV